MDNTKIAYLKRHLDQALSDDNIGEANNCYQELLKLVDASDISDIAKKMSEYNKTHANQLAQASDAKSLDLKANVRNVSAKRKRNVQIAKGSFIIWGVGMGLGFLMVMMGAGIFGSYDDNIMYVGVALAAIGFLALIPGVTGLFARNKCDLALANLGQPLLDYVCEQEAKLQYLEGIQTVDNLFNTRFPIRYIGQLQDEQANGFGVAYIVDTGFYAGEWKNNVPRGIGKLYSYDLLYTLEGEFKNRMPDGMTDIQWEDGSEWHGTYKNGQPWNGQGKTKVNGKVKQGVWKNGIFLNQ